jgi:hypothetical protein
MVRSMKRIARPVRARAALAALVSALALVAGGCGGDGNPSTTEWADGVCRAISDWGSSVEGAARSVTEGGLSQDGIQNAVDELRSATDTFVDDIESLGRPDTESGEQAQDAVEELGDELESGVDTIEDAVSNVDGLSGVSAAITTVTDTLGAMASDVQAALQELEALDAQGELQSAFEQADACQSLTD